MLSIASTALRAYRNKHQGTLMRCCEAWKPIEDCFDPISFECVDFQRPSQIIASLTRENLEAREAEVTNFPWTQTEKDSALARCRSALANEMGSTDDNFSPTGYEPNDYFLTETYVEFNQESVTKQGFPEDLDYDDTVIGQTLFNAYRRRVDHSEREGLFFGQSSR